MLNTWMTWNLSQDTKFSLVWCICLCTHDSLISRGCECYSVFFFTRQSGHLDNNTPWWLPYKKGHCNPWYIYFLNYAAELVVTLNMHIAAYQIRCSGFNIAWSYNSPASPLKSSGDLKCIHNGRSSRFSKNVWVTDKIHSIWKCYNLL